ncbi:helix-turn-helix domain-containing protein [Pelagibacterium luteolum]|uniref:Transcriptional regulator, XRE family n=1 Tax=Pelagibacterium luteolum TaxID=440168 RepID=A0A1G7VEH1_9HYPH|nr:helix-turn-helix transcriptional regulator [Pelagibacterium luteolum]SDG57951.1 transcriptional regulator, XRE family [Pelagibacterium luteolum]
MLDDTNIIVGKNIREARTNILEISQDELARRVGLSRPSVANIESGRQQVTVHQLMIFSNALGIPAYRLLPNTPEKNEDLAEDAYQVEPGLQKWLAGL